MTRTNQTNIPITIISRHKGKLNKTISQDAAGDIIKSSIAQLTHGYAKVVTVSCMADLAVKLDNCANNEAFILGVPWYKQVPIREAQVYTKRGIKNKSDNFSCVPAITRTKEFFSFPENNPAFLLFDVDDNLISINKIWDVLSEIDPELSKNGYVIKESSSSNIYSKNGKKITGCKGLHIFVPVENGNDIARYGKAFCEKSWLHGLGHIKVSSVGSLLERYIVDHAVFSPERLIFEAKPTLSEGLVQHTKPTRYTEGKILDTSTFFLTTAEVASVNALKGKAKNECLPIAKTKQKEWINSKAVYICKNRNIPLNKVKKELGKSLATNSVSVLQTLTFDRLGKILVSEVLKNLDNYNNEYLADPYDEKVEPSKAIFNAYSTPSPHIFSFKHGGTKYYLPQVALPTQTTDISKRKRVKKRHLSRFIYNIKSFINYALSEEGVSPHELSRKMLLSLSVKKNLFNEQETIKSILSSHEKKTLVHFTPIHNVGSILKMGLIPRFYLETPMIKEYLNPYFIYPHDVDIDWNSSYMHLLNGTSIKKLNLFHNVDFAIILTSTQTLIRNKCDYINYNTESGSKEKTSGSDSLQEILGQENQVNMEPFVCDYSVIPPSNIKSIHFPKECRKRSTQKRADQLGIKIHSYSSYFTDN